MNIEHYDFININWCELLYDYVIHYYNIKVTDWNEFIIMALCLDGLNKNKIKLCELPIVDYELNLHSQRIVYDIFNKYLPDNYFWDRDIEK